MKTAEHNTVSVASNQKSEQPFFSKEAAGSFFSESKGRQTSFFKPSSHYSVNGNGVIQAKLTIGKPNDKYEQEADAMADKVVQRLATPNVLTKNETSVQAKPLAGAITPLIQTKCATCEQEDKLQMKEEEDLIQESQLELQRKPIFESNAERPDGDNNIQQKCAECEQKERLQKKGEEGFIQESPLELQPKPIFESDTDSPDNENNIQRKCAECEKEENLQKKSDSPTLSTVSSSIERSLDSSKGKGFTMPADTKTQMENSFGSDFSNVHLHTDSVAVQMSKDLHAQAFTDGNDIYFNSGKYDTKSKGGKHLLAHELTHTFQQGSFKTTNLIQRQNYIDIELVGPIDQYTIPGTKVSYQIGDASGPNILVDIIMGSGNSLTFYWYNFTRDILITGNLQSWDFIYGLGVFNSNTKAFASLGRQLTANEWRQIKNDPVPTLLKKYEENVINIPDDAILSMYRGLIYTEAKRTLDENEQNVDSILTLRDNVQQFQDYADGLREASMIRDILETRKKEIEKSLVQSQGFSFGYAGRFVNLNPYRRLQQNTDLHEINSVVTFWYQSFPLLSRLRTDEINTASIESKLLEIKQNIISTRPQIDAAAIGKGSIDLLDLDNIRAKVNERIGSRGMKTIQDEDKSRRRWGWIKSALALAGSIALLFVPGGWFIDLVIGLAIAKKSWDEARVIGKVANSGLHVDDGLMSQAAVNSAYFNAVLSTVFAVIGAGAGAFRVLRIARNYRIVSKLPLSNELTFAQRVNIARTLASNPKLVTVLRTTEDLQLLLQQYGLKMTAAEIQAIRQIMYLHHRIPFLPQGITNQQFISASRLIRQKVGYLSSDIRVHGSRAFGTAKAPSDIDIAIRVTDETFDDVARQSFKNVKPNTANYKTMQHALKTGKIQAGEARVLMQMGGDRLRVLRKELQSVFGMDVDISVVRIGGAFDQGPWIPIQ